MTVDPSFKEWSMYLIIDDLERKNSEIHTTYCFLKKLGLNYNQHAKEIIEINTAWVKVEDKMSGKNGFKKPLSLNIPPPIRELECQKIPMKTHR